jgi:hypothetical protein
MDTSVAAVTVKVVVPEMLPILAVMDAEPALLAVASPTVVPVVLIETTFGLAELQVTDEEISFFVPSL